MKVAFLGPEGTYTHQAVDQYFKNYEPITCSSVKESINSEAEAAVIPFENSLGGGVGESVDLLRKTNLKIAGEIKVEIKHVLASKQQKLEQIQNVVSHPQALTQSRKFIQKHGLNKREASSTAKAAQEINKNEAAICSKKAAEINNLEIITDTVQDQKSNTTRFLVLKKQSTVEGDKTSLILEPDKDRPGLLESMLSCFSGHGINLAYIQSRPTRDGLGNYYFYIEAETNQKSEKFQNTLKCVQTYADVKTLGSYQKA